MSYCEKYGYEPSDEKIGENLELIAAGLDAFDNPEVYRKCFSLMDLTTLHPNDTVSSVSKLVSKVTRLREEYPTYPLPASICVYPNFASVVRDLRCSENLHVTTVSSCFPSTQSFLDVKVLECELAVENGADEIDIVLSLANFLGGNEAEAFREISEMKHAISAKASEAGREVILKVILETGLLGSAERIAEASFLAMEAGADFIKTSTGKVDVNATPMAAFVMCECIKVFYAKTGRKVGFKAAGGISVAKDALCYYSIVSSVLGEEWLDRCLLRFGVSRLGNSLMSAIEQKTVSFF